LYRALIFFGVYQRSHRGRRPYRTDPTRRPERGEGAMISAVMEGDVYHLPWDTAPIAIARSSWCYITKIFFTKHRYHWKLRRQGQARLFMYTGTHCREPIPKIRNKYSHKRNCSRSFHILVSVSDFYIPTIDLPILLQEICGPILGIYKSLTDKWMWQLGLRPRHSQKRNI
jgi:hypothetical protein